MSETKMVRAEDLRPTRKEKVLIKDRMRGMLMFLPNMAKLLAKLLTDSRVPLADKALFAGAIVYFISPIDLIPDFLPFIGQMDDAYLIALTLLRLINRTDESIVREHWSGGGDIISLANTIANIAPKLLPKRIARVLSSEVELGDAGKILKSAMKKKTPLVVEHPEAE